MHGYRLAKLNIKFYFINDFLSYINQDNENNLTSKKKLTIFSLSNKST